jgi:hypothetical protein
LDERWDQSAQELSVPDVLQPIASFANRPNLAPYWHPVSAAGLKAVAASADSAVGSHTDPYSGRFVEFLATLSEKTRIAAPSDAFVVADIGLEDTVQEETALGDIAWWAFD